MKKVFTCVLLISLMLIVACSKESTEPNQLAAPVISPSSCILEFGSLITMTCSTPGAGIYYTLDGSEPSQQSNLYQQAFPMELEGDVTIKAVAVLSGWIDSQITTVEYGVFSPEFFTVDGGTFNNGVSQITLNSFKIRKFEVTQSEYASVMGTNPGTEYGVGDDFPAYNMSWYNAIEYCNRRSIMDFMTPCYSYSTYGTDPDSWPSNWDANSDNHVNVTCNWNATGYRLPTEMEWMFAAMGGNQSMNYTYSGGNDIDEVAWYSDNANGLSHIVGEKKHNEIYLSDMSGNVREWVWDRYGSYLNENQTNPTGSNAGPTRVVRGGCWYSTAPNCSISYRASNNADYTGQTTGFRIVKTNIIYK